MSGIVLVIFVHQCFSTMRGLGVLAYHTTLYVITFHRLNVLDLYPALSFVCFVCLLSFDCVASERSRVELELSSSHPWGVTTRNPPKRQTSKYTLC